MYDPDTIVERVTEAVGAATDSPPENLPPLYEAVDTDAVAAVLDHADGRGSARPSVEFRYAGFTVRITTETVAVVEERDADGDREPTTVASRPLP